MHERYAALDTPPLSIEQFADNPAGLREFLEDSGALTFTPYASGLFPASDLPPHLSTATGMGMAWMRDNAHVANALFETGRHDLAIPAGKALLAVLNSNRDVVDGVVHGTRDISERGGRLPARVQGHNLAKDQEFRVQNDAVGYPLWLIGKFIQHDAIQPTQYDMDTLAQTVRYLSRIAYWQDRDTGHWEEDMRVHATSIGAVIAGLEQTEQAMRYVGYRHDLRFDELITRGRNTLDAMIERGFTDVPSIADWAKRHAYGTIPENDFLRSFTGQYRRHDAGMLFLIEPLGVLNSMQANIITADVETHLVREQGTIRYPGDTYWGPRFKDIMPIDERTSQAPGRLELRNTTAGGVAFSQTEAQWTIFDSPQSTLYGRQFMQTGDPIAHSKQLIFLNRVLAQLVPSDGKLLLPETFYLDRVPVPCGEPTNQWIPNDHQPLLWAQANLLLALKTFEETGV